MNLFLAIQTSIVEIAFFGFITLIVGFVIHYLWSLRHGNSEMQDIQNRKFQDEAQQWRLKYYEITEQRQNNTDDLQRQLEISHKRHIELQEEMQEMQQLNNQLLQASREIKAAPATDGASSSFLQKELEQSLEKQQELMDEIAELQELNSYLKQSAKEKQVTEVHNPINEDLKGQLERALARQIEMQDEMEEMKQLNAQLKQQSREVSTTSAPAPSVNSNEYLQQLRMAQEYLAEHNQTIEKLLKQSESMDELQSKYTQALQLNETLNHQLHTVQNRLLEKEEEIQLVNQRVQMTAAMKEQLETAYAEFQEMQEKLLRVENQLAQPTGQLMKYEELEEANRILNGEVVHARARQKELVEENSRLQQDVTELETQLRELEHQKQQVANRNEFLEQLNKDLQEMNEQNKRMVTQMRRLTEIESMMSKITGDGK